MSLKKLIDLRREPASAVRLIINKVCMMNPRNFILFVNPKLIERGLVNTQLVELCSDPFPSGEHKYKASDVDVLLEEFIARSLAEINPNNKEGVKLEEEKEEGLETEKAVKGKRKKVEVQKFATPVEITHEETRDVFGVPGYVDLDSSSDSLVFGKE